MSKKVSQETIEKRKATIKAKALKKESKTVINKGLKESITFKDDKSVLKTSLKLLSKFSKHKAKVEVKTLPIKYKKNNVFSIYFNTDKSVTYKQIEKMGKDLSNDLKAKGLSGEIGISMKFDFGWLPSVFRSFGEFHLFNPTHSDFEYEQNDFNEFELYLVETPSDKGGNDKNNNCLYHCLKDIFFDNTAWADGLQMKKYLKLKFYDKVPISMIPLIESKQNCRINITGDYVYTSTKDSNKEVNLKLINEHYSLDLSNVKGIVNKFKISNVCKKPIIYDAKTLIAYDGKKLYTLKPQERKDHMNHRTDYILVSKSNDKHKKTHKEDYDDFVRDADLLLEKTNGIINMYKTGNDKVTALNLFDYMTKHITPDDIEQAEANWINKASLGALIFAQPYEGPAYDYDVKSQYPSIMKSGTLFPIKKGTFLKIDSLPTDFFKYGIYRVIISKSDDVNINKLFRFNYDNYYTHFDLTNAKSLGLSIKLIVDDQPNFLHYSRDCCLTGNEIFGPYVNFLFELKQLDITPRTKSILNILWGALCEKKLTKSGIDATSKVNYDIPELDILHSIQRLSSDTYFLKHQSTVKQYKTSFARICPFLISKGRSNMATLMKPYKDHLVKVHTDGFLLTEEGKELKLSNTLGGLVLEGKYECVKIINNCKPEIIQ